MDNMSIAAEQELEKLSNIVVSLDIVVKTLQSNPSNLDFASRRVIHSLEHGDYEGAMAAFDVLDVQCGCKLPIPRFLKCTRQQVSNTPEKQDEQVMSEPDMSYDEKIHLVADILNSCWVMHRILIKKRDELILKYENDHNISIILRALDELYMPASYR